MGSGKPNESEFPSILGGDGTIDLAGGLGVPPASRRRTTRPSGDAWVVDRDRRSLLPASPAIAAPSSGPDGTPSTEDIHREIADRFALGDFAGALSAAELQLGVDPTDEAALHYAETSRTRLETRYTTRIGSLDYIFNLAVPTSKVKWLGLDPQAAFLLSLVDGQTTVAEVLELCQTGRLEALRVFTELLDAKAILRVA